MPSTSSTVRRRLGHIFYSAAMVMAAISFAPTSAQATSPLIIRPPLHWVAPVPKPTPAQFTAFETALASCKRADGSPLLDNKGDVKAMLARIQQINAFPRTWNEWNERMVVAGLASALLYPAFPDAKANQVIAAMGDMMRPRYSCAPHPQEALTILNWLADDIYDTHFVRGQAHAWLGFAAREGIGQSANPLLARQHFLKARLFNKESAYSAYTAPAYWSDGVDNDVYANMERQNLRLYLEATASTPTGFMAREIAARHWVKSDIEQARYILQNRNEADALTLLKMEKEGLIPPRYTDAELAYWLDVAQRPDAEYAVREKALEVAAHLNGGHVPINNRPLRVEQAFPRLDTTQFDGIQLPAHPMPLRALITPYGWPALVVTCQWDEPASLEERGNIRNYTLAVKEALPRMQPVTLNDKPVYGWVILPAPYKPQSRAGSATTSVAFQQTSDQACHSNPLLKQQEKIPPPRRQHK